jgi:hypothetical protein
MPEVPPVPRTEPTSSPGPIEEEDPLPENNQDDDDDDDDDSDADDNVALTKRPRKEHIDITSLPNQQVYTIEEQPSKEPWEKVYPWAKGMVKGLMRQAHDAKQEVTFM